MTQMVKATLSVNGIRHDVSAHPDTPLLWILREHLKLTGTKYGCGKGQCGACTVHLDGNHPLAGQHLQVSLKVREVREATAEEIEHRHAHGAHGHHH